jgi:hypothetical protein
MGHDGTIRSRNERPQRQRWERPRLRTIPAQAAETGAVAVVDANATLS